MNHFMYFFLLFSTLTLSAQSISGTIQDNNLPVSFANVMLYKSADTTLAKFTYSDDDGKFVLDNVSNDTYYLQVSYVGLQDYKSEPFQFESKDKNLGNINMTAGAVSLNEVVVTASKPMMEVKPDKLVLNVAGSVLASGDDALSLLRKAPGVLVDNNENISLLGKSGLVIYIDGKPSPLTSTELANMLKNMSSNDIESIEIISNPSAKYEAQGTAGIINIKRKKLNKDGINGSANAAVRQGETFGFNGGLNLNFRNEKVNVFGNAGYFDSDNSNYNDFFRTQNDLGFHTYNKSQNNSKGYNAKVSTDYYLSKKSTLGFIAEHQEDDFFMTNASTTSMGNPTFTQIDSLLLNDAINIADSKNSNINANYYYDGGNETTFNVDANLGRFSRNNNSYTPNLYTTADRNTITSRFETRSITPTIIDIMSVKMDYERKLGKGKISGGLKSSMVATDNTFNFFNIEGKEEILNANFSNRFKYDEWVNAAYANYAIQIKKVGVNAGLRVENSNTKGDLIAMNPSNNKLVKRNYTDFFPSFGLSYSPNDKHSLQASYGRRINRPNYQDLNPFELQLDQLTFEKGNAFLNPEYTDNIQLTHTYAYKFTTTLTYSHTSDVITRLVDTSGLKGSFITWDNIAYRKIYSVGFSAPISITDKWSTFTNFNGIHTRNNAQFEDGKTINLNVSSFNMYHQQSYNFNKGWSVEISGWYTSPSIWEGTFTMNEMWSAGAGVSKKFAGDRAKVTLSFDDIFKTNVWSGESRFGGLNMDVSGGWDSRRVRLNVNYSFGKQSKSAERKRSTGAEDEQNRIKKG